MEEKPAKPVNNPPAQALPGKESVQPDKPSSPLLPFILLNGLAWLDIIAIRVLPAASSVFTAIGFALVPLGVISGIVLMIKSNLTYQQFIGGFSALLLTTVGFLEL